MHHQYDKSSKWLIQHYGDSILRLAGVRDFFAWQPLAATLYLDWYAAHATTFPWEEERQGIRSRLLVRRREA